jgi:hypothetical protein
MKYILIIFLLVASSNSFGQRVKTKQSFAIYFRILDSLALVTNTDTVYAVKSVESVHFMEKHTKIYSSTTGNFYGRLGFTKHNLEQWHEWYRKKYGEEK